MSQVETSYPSTQLLIANQWRDAADGRRLDVRNPATGQVIGQVAHAGKADLDLALAAAQKGFEVWRRTPAPERAAVMRRAAGLLRERAGRIAALLTQEQGKPLAEARVETLSAAGIIEWFAEEGCRVYGRIVPSRNIAAQQQVLKEPIGPVAAFTPWNFPINQVVRKLCGALSTGCSILVKAPEETPASPAELVRAFVDAGVPEGVVGLVYGDRSLPPPQRKSPRTLSGPAGAKHPRTRSRPHADTDAHGQARRLAHLPLHGTHCSRRPETIPPAGTVRPGSAACPG